MNRREFLLTSTAAAAGLVGTSCQSDHASAPKGRRIAFNTANIVSRVSVYRYELSRWGEQHQKTVAATDERAWDSICEGIE